MHIYDFLTDREQFEIKKTSRMVDVYSRFEDVIAAYSQLFLQKFDALTSTEDSRYLNEPLKSDVELAKWLSRVLQIVKTDRKHIERLLDDILEVYRVFISGKHQIAVSLLYYLLEKYDLLDGLSDEQLGCFYRGRPITQGDDYMKESYYYHIPFNMRYLVKNQRFSFSGMPMLYAGESLAASFFELGAKNLDDKTIGIASFNFDHLAHVHEDRDGQRIKSKNQIFDITNVIYNLINDIFFDALERGKKLNAGTIDYFCPPVTIRRAFRKFILSQICTFPRKHHIDNQHFVEEYVLPQLLTEAIRQHKYDGILYPSTRFVNKKLDLGKGWHNMLFKANIAMFTTYTQHEPYDEDLFKTVVPHVVDLSKIRDVDANDELDRLNIAILSTEKFLVEKTTYSPTQQKFLAQLIHLEKKIKTYLVLSIDKVPYLKTYAGKVEATYMTEYFRYIVHLIRRVYQKEYDAEYQIL